MAARVASMSTKRQKSVRLRLVEWRSALEETLGLGVHAEARAVGAGAALGGVGASCGLRNGIASSSRTISLYVQWENNTTWMRRSGMNPRPQDRGKGHPAISPITSA